MNASEPCPTCKGTGIETWTGPFAGSCSKCRGLGRLAITEELVRKKYAKIRVAVCSERGMKGAEFDAMVRKKLPKDASPAHWLESARGLAEKFGIEV